MSTAHTDTTGLRALEPLWSIDDLAAYLGVPVATIYDWRSNGKGPVAHRFGKHLKFAVADVRTWMEGQREPSPGAVVANQHHRSAEGGDQR
jgi:excisionase family DNA binding protein